MKKKLAIFDVDGTLFNGNLGIEFIKKLTQNGIQTKENAKTIMFWYLKYKNGEVKKSVAVDEIYKMHALGLKNSKEKEVKKVAEETWKEIKNKRYGFAANMIKKIKDQGYIVFLLSGSPTEIIEIFGNDLGIEKENILAGEIEIADGIYTGNIVFYPGSAEQKVEALMNLIQRKNIDVDWKNSMAMGDNERDAKVLGMVGNPIAFDPNEELKILAQNNNWKIADENTVLLMIAGEDEI